MKFFVDTAEIKEIRELLEMNLIDGVTTNPSLIAKSGSDIKETIKNKISSLLYLYSSGLKTYPSSTGFLWM